MSLLRPLIVKNSHILDGIYFIFLKKTSYIKLERFSIANLDMREKIENIWRNLNLIVYNGSKKS